jgi:murein DD-endopeptidase MepM/ murein hydrolase activator NlpD
LKQISTVFAVGSAPKDFRSYLLSVRILILRPGAPSVALTLRQRWLLAAVPGLLLAPWLLGMAIVSRGGAAATGGPATAGEPAEVERQRISSLGRKLSLLESQLDRLGVKTPTGTGGRGGPVVPLTLVDLEQEVQTALTRVQALSSHREALSAQLQRRYGLNLPIGNLPLGVPMRGAYDYTSGYGLRSDPWSGATTAHNGIDLAADVGATIVANAPGRVVTCQDTEGYGLMLELDHGGGLATRYGHLSACRVRVGDRVQRDQPIASVGNSGRSTGPHLHYEVLVKGRSIDPAPLVWLSSVSPS